MAPPGGSDGKESACKAGDLGSIPGLGRSPGEGKGYPPQYSGLENSMDSIVHGVTKSQTFTFTLRDLDLQLRLPAQENKYLGWGGGRPSKLPRPLRQPVES